MLRFFRKYQKIFFIIITAVVISTFVFFGTYQVMRPIPKMPDEPAFTTVNGNEVGRIYLDQFCRFLCREDGMLNDGVMQKDFFDTGLTSVFVERYREFLKKDFKIRHDKEKSFAPYSHPEAKWINAEGVWDMFAPGIKENLSLLQNASDPLSSEAITARIDLYLSEKVFPAPYLKQVLYYQIKQMNGLYPDARLQRGDLSLFGYDDLSDWFGQGFVEAVAQMIINAAEIARGKGYRVTRDEISADLSQKCEKQFRAVKDRLPSHIANGFALYQEGLRQFEMSETAFFKIWENVLLFRRLLEDTQSGAMIDALALKEFFPYAKESVEVELYQLPFALHFRDENELKNFEAYLHAVSKPLPIASLELPQAYEALEVVQKKAPQLVRKCFPVKLVSLSKHALQLKVGVKESWDWEIADKNWEKIKQKFPELALKNLSSAEERLGLLDKFDAEERNKIDLFARSCIVEEHPEWVESALKERPLEMKTLKIRDTSSPLAGIEDVKTFTHLLETKSPLLCCYSQDRETFYRIEFTEDSPTKEILTYEEAAQEGVLTELPPIPDEHFQLLIAAMRKEGKEGNSTLRFARYLKRKREELLQNKPEEEVNALTTQWKLVKQQETLSRSAPSFLPMDQVAVLEKNALSELNFLPEKGLCFYRFVGNKRETSLPVDKLIEAQSLLAAEAKRAYMSQLLETMDAKNAIVFMTDK